MLKRSAEEMYDASAAVLTKGLLNFKPAGWRIIPGYFMTRKQTDRLIFYGSGHTIIQPECGKTRNLEIVFNARFQVSFKAIWSVKMNVKSLKNILIVNHNFVVTIGLPYCYLPFKVIFRTNYFHEILWPTSHVLLICMHKNKGHNYY
jgi:hypothetical protein